MDSSAGSETREFIPFRSGKESNGQATQTSSETRSTTSVPTTVRPNTTIETSGPVAREIAPADTHQLITNSSLPEVLPSKHLMMSFHWHHLTKNQARKPLLLLSRE